MTDIFVFGSNLAGRHGKGSALEAVLNYGAVYGQSWGLQGDSFAIPTKGYALEPLPLVLVEHFCQAFVTFAHKNSEHNYNVVAIGCGLAGFKPSQIAPFFNEAPLWCNLPAEFISEYLR